MCLFSASTKGSYNKSLLLKSPLKNQYFVLLAVPFNFSDKTPHLPVVSYFEIVIP